MLSDSWITFVNWFENDKKSSFFATKSVSHFILHKVDGIYDKDPFKFQDALKISEITYSDYLNKDIKVMDATAISLAKDRSIPIIIFSILKSSNILEIIEGKGNYSIIN